MRFKIYILFILSLFVGNQLFAQQFTAAAKLDTFQIEIGDQVYLELSVVKEKNTNVAFPRFKDKIIDGIDIVSINATDTVNLSAKEQKISQKILITSFEDSLFNIPQLPFISGIDTVYSNNISFDVQMLSMDSAAVSKIDTTQMLRIFDVKSPIHTPWTFKEFWQNYHWYIIGLLVLIILIVLIRYVYKRRKENRPFFKIAKPKEPAHIIALRKLNELKQNKLWQSGREKEYYSELTFIVREYIENRYDISAMERTSHQLLEVLKHSKVFDKERIPELVQILQLGDLAKFAKFKPLPDENDLSLKNAFSIVENTIPETVEETEEEKTETNNEPLQDETVSSNEDKDDEKY
jgi:hypothetical protein